MANFEKCTKCGKWVHGRRVKIKGRLQSGKRFVSELCVDTMEGIVRPGEEISFFHQIDFVKNFC